MVETEIVIPENIMTKTTDGRGRLTLGKEYSNKRVTVAVIDATAHGTEISIAPSNQEVSVGQSVVYDVIVGTAPNRVGSYGIEINVRDPTIAKIIDATDRVNPKNADITLSQDGGSVGIATFGGSSDMGQVAIASITVQAQQIGSTDLILGFPGTGGVTDPAANTYNVSALKSSQISVVDD